MDQQYTDDKLRSDYLSTNKVIAEYMGWTDVHVGTYKDGGLGGVLTGKPPADWGMYSPIVPNYTQSLSRMRDVELRLYTDQLWLPYLNYLSNEVDDTDVLFNTFLCVISSAQARSYCAARVILDVRLLSYNKEHQGEDAEKSEGETS